MLPNFLGIGVPRAGTTWLHELLSTHPEIYVPTQRKEIHYFDRYYDKGPDWYEKFFPSADEAAQYKAIGEISPEYMFSKKCLERIAKVRSINKFLLMLRNPIDRAYSYYGLKVRNTNYKGSFDEFIDDQPVALGRGYYSRHLKSFYNEFSKDQLLVVITEQAVADVQKAKSDLAGFLGVSADLFPAEAGRARVNQSYVPRAPALYSLIVNTSKKLRRWDGLTDFVKLLGVKKAFRSENTLPSLTRDTRVRLQPRFKDEITRVEDLLRVDLQCWRRSA